MKRFDFTVEKTSDGYSAFYEFKSGDIAATVADDLTELKTNALEALNLTLDHLNQQPANLDDINLCFDLKLFFDSYPIMSLVADRISANRSLLSQYTSDNIDKKPSVKQLARIEKGIQQLGKELAMIQLV